MDVICTYGYIHVEQYILKYFLIYIYVIFFQYIFIQHYNIIKLKIIFRYYVGKDFH